MPLKMSVDANAALDVVLNGNAQYPQASLETTITPLHMSTFARFEWAPQREFGVQTETSVHSTFQIIAGHQHRTKVELKVAEKNIFAVSSNVSVVDGHALGQVNHKNDMGTPGERKDKSPESASGQAKPAALLGASGRTEIVDDAA